MFSRSLALLLGSVVLGACGGGGSEGDEEEVVKLGAVSDDLSVQPMMDGDGNLLTPTALKGTYGNNCKIHGGDKWTLQLNDPDDKLELVLNDTFANCPLTVTAIQSKLGPMTVDSPLHPPIVLGNGFAAEPSAVNFDHTPIFVFYANARLTGLDAPRYTNDFAIHLIHSDDAEVCGQTAPPPVYAKVTAIAEVSSVPPPDYSMGFDGLQLVVDADKIVQDSSTGNIMLMHNGQPGEEWRIFDEATLCCEAYTFAAIDFFYKHMDPVASGAIEGEANVALDWTSFDLEGKKLPKARTVIVKHSGEGGIYSYQLFQLLFPGPTQ